MNVYDHAELNDAGARYWLAMDGWDKDQAAYLLHAIDPLLLKVWTKASGGRLEINFPEQFDSLTAMIARAFEAGALPFPAAPSAVIAWANSKHLKLPVQFIGYSEPSSVPVVAKGVSNAVEPWKEKARNSASLIIKRDRAKGLYPSQLHISDEIAKQFRNDGVNGNGGKPLTGAYIKRHALKGISSEQGKQLSTTNSRGK